MTLEDAIHYRLSNDAGVSDLVGARIYKVKLPQLSRTNSKAQLPAITYQKISGQQESHQLGGTNLHAAVLQVSCWSGDYSQCKSLVEAVKSCLSWFSGDIGTVEDHLEVLRIAYLGDLDEFEEPQDGSDGGTFHVPVDFEVSYRA